MVDDTDRRKHIIGTLLQQTFGELPKNSKIEKTGFIYRFNEESAKSLVDFRKKSKKSVRKETRSSTENFCSYSSFQ